ncbi:hypothetical protein SELMODRAFT_100276 [Selaginella moellendorffii]|uniref:Pentacotripeptide-repeat region of PRORP domain-containing protein n=1 Tax=Selaginella moellendorffii TaxID=88036 RepID=D8RSD4_SELML|nr:hypothetical protein SELMODRAFT_100276 [Selaginella moellendorffii]
MNSMLAMLARIASVEECEKVFRWMPERSLISWTSMLAAYGQEGDLHRAMQVFDEMPEIDLVAAAADGPDASSFVSALAAASHAGRVGLGVALFASMAADFGIAPVQQHWSCMVDLFARSGHLWCAEELLAHMPFAPDALEWRSLLAGASRVGGAGGSGDAAAALASLDDASGGGHALLANLCSRV